MRRHGLVMQVLAIAIMSQQQAGVTNFLSQRTGVSTSVIALLLGVPFAVGGVLMYTRWGSRHVSIVLIPSVIYALLAMYLAATGTGNYVPAIYYAWTYYLLVELANREAIDGTR